MRVVRPTGALDLAVQVFDRYANAKLQGGEYSVLRRWLEDNPGRARLLAVPD